MAQTEKRRCTNRKEAVERREAATRSKSGDGRQRVLREAVPVFPYVNLTSRKRRRGKKQYKAWQERRGGKVDWIYRKELIVRSRWGLYTSFPASLSRGIDVLLGILN